MEPVAIKLHDKRFNRYINDRIIERAVAKVADDMCDDLKNKNPLFLCVLNGAFMFAADLLRQFPYPCNIAFVKFASYEGTKSTGKVKKIIGLQEEVKGRTVVIIEDIVDSGNTIEMLVAELKKDTPKQILVSTMFFKREVYKKEIPINYFGIEISDRFIVGYGLDYNGLGRNFKSIYLLNQKM